MIFKFYLLPYYIPDNYTPELIALAEGFKELGIQFYSNINYWYEPETGEYLFKESDSDSYDVGIYDYRYIYHSKKWTPQRVNQDKINILHDRNDWLSPEWLDSRILDVFDFILANHLLQFVNYPDKVKPWAIGYTNRIAKYIDKYRISDLSRIEKEIACNFRVGHNLRGLIMKKLDQIDTLNYPINFKTTDSTNPNQVSIQGSNIDNHYWKETGHRHNPEYYKLINQSLLTYAFGGYYEYKPFCYQPYNLLDKIKRKPNYYITNHLIKKGKDPSQYCFTFQYDSFRMWETLYASTCPILLDASSWGYKLPVIPENGIHYLGISGFDTESFANNLNNLTADKIFEISKNGSKWVKKHYSPIAVAKRLLKLTFEK